MKSGTVCIHFQHLNEDQRSIVIAMLSDNGFDSFEETDHELTAFIPAAVYSKETLDSLLGERNFSYTEELIGEQNWNELWESNFKPVIIDGVCIRASFHPIPEHSLYDIIVTPKMSFGTGHHATTSMMVQCMMQMDLTNKTVLDFGTGTGVLAILAEKLGAEEIDAIDIDDWSITNAKENLENNHCLRVDVIRMDNASMNKRYDTILSNINLHVIMSNIKDISEQMKNGGSFLLSGVLINDEPELLNAAKSLGLHLLQRFTQDNWLLLRFIR